MRMKPIPSTCGRYWAGEDGRIYSDRRMRPLKPFHEEGYAIVVLWNGEARVERRVCRLVAEAWCDGFTSSKEVHHIDGDCTNDRPSNLLPLSSAAHMRMHGRHVNDIDYAECEAMAASAPPPHAFGPAGRIEALMADADRVRERLAAKGVAL